VTAQTNKPGLGASITNFFTRQNGLNEDFLHLHYIAFKNNAFLLVIGKITYLFRILVSVRQQ
jgi:hypothetical protein